MRLWAWLKAKFLWVWPRETPEHCEAEFRGRECVVDPALHTYQHQNERGFRWAS